MNDEQAIRGDEETESAEDGRNRRSHDRYEVTWAVDCENDDTFLYASITNISAMGIFVRTLEPLPVGTQLSMSFTPHTGAAFRLEGAVAWVNSLRTNEDNPNPGMGIRFIDLALPDRERLVEIIHTIAYVRDPS